MCDHAEREAAMVIIEGTPIPGVTTKVGSCDPCLLPLIQALNDAGFYTVASCCGHTRRPGRITLADGRELFLVADFEAATELSLLIPGDINDRPDIGDRPEETP